MIALIDYGAGNLRSVHKALRFLNADVRVVTEPAGLKEAGAVVLGDVGRRQLGAVERLEVGRDREGDDAAGPDGAAGGPAARLLSTSMR